MIFSSFYSSDSKLFSFWKKVRLPRFIYSSLSHLLLPLIGSTKLPSRSNLAEPPRNPTFEERTERIRGERTALERERDRGFGGRYGLNLIRRRRRNEQPPLIPETTVTITDLTQNETNGTASGDESTNERPPANARTTAHWGRGQSRSWVFLQGSGSSLRQGEPSIASVDSSQPAHSGTDPPTSPSRSRGLRSYLNRSESLRRDRLLR